MRSLQRILLLMVLSITCTFGTGFLSSGESPEDAIKAVITAIENNDAAAFNERVTTGYWESFFSDYGQNHNDTGYAWLKDLISNADSMKAIQKLDLDRATLPSAILYTLPKAVAELITKGDFANYCRKYKSPTLPFDPNILKKLTYADEGKDAHKGITSAVATMPDGQESVLGLAKMGEKWYIVSSAGNRKAAMDKAVTARDALQEKAKLIAERKQRYEAFINEFKSVNELRKQLHKDNKLQDLAKLSIQNTNLLDYPDSSQALPTDEKGFWQHVSNSVVSSVRNKHKNENTEERIKNSIEYVGTSFYAFFINNVDEMTRSEILWKTDNVMLSRSMSSSTMIKRDKDGNLPENIEVYQQLRNKWLNDDVENIKQIYYYFIYYKQNDIWQSKIYATERFEPFSTKPKSTRYYPFGDDPKGMKLSVEQYMLELAKRFDGMYTEAKTQVANEERWTKEIQDTFASLNKAITNNQPEVFEKHMDIATFLRDRNSLEQVAIVIAKNQDSNVDVQNFLDQVRTGVWAENTPAKNGFRDITIYTVAELQAIALDNDGTLILLERKDANSPWKVIREGSRGSILNRPKDWDTRLAERVKVHTAQFKLEQSVMDVLATLQKAKTDKNPKVFEQYLDLPMFLRDNGDVEKTAIAIADNEKSNADVKVYLEQVSTNKFTDNTPLSGNLSKFVLIKLTNVEAVVNVINDNILLQRKTEKDAWTIIRHGKSVDSLQRPKNWLADVTARSKEIIEERAKEEARKQKALADMQKKMQTVSAGIIKAIADKDAATFFKYVDVSTLLVKLEDKFNTKEKNYRDITKTQLAPLRSLEQKIEQALTAQKPLGDIAVLWDANALGKASYAFLDSSEKNVIATIASTDGDYYALFTPFKSSYKLILAPTKNKALLEKEGNSVAQMWSEILANYALDTTRKDFLQFVDLLQSKKGKELVEQVNIANLVSWKDALDKKNNLEEQVYKTLFAKDSYNKPRADIAEMVTSSGLLQYGVLDLNASEFEVSTFYALTSNIIVIKEKEGKKNLLFAKKDGKFHLEAIAEELNDVQRGQFKDNYLAREKLLAEEQKSVIRSVAMQSTSNAALDLLQVIDGNYEVFKTEKGTMQLRVKVIVKNTYDKPIKPLKFMMYFVDVDGQNWQPWVTGIKSEEFKPNQSKDFEWEFFPNEKESYLLQQVQAGKMHLMVRTAEAEINKKNYKRFGTMVDPKELPSGLWQLDNFAPIKPMPQWTSAPEAVQKALWDGMKKSKTALTAHSSGINNTPQVAATTQATPKSSEQEKTVKPEDTATLVETATPTETDKPENTTAQTDKPTTPAPSTTQAPAPVATPPATSTDKPTPAVATPPATPTAQPTTQPTAPAPKKPGKAVIVPITIDSMSLTSFAPDKKPDSSIRVLAQGKSPLIAVRVESMGGGNASWKTKDVKTKAQGVLAVMQDGKLINAKDASFSIDVSNPVSLDLIMQDNGAIADAKARLRVIFFHKDGSRTYSIIQR